MTPGVKEKAACAMATALAFLGKRSLVVAAAVFMMDDGEDFEYHGDEDEDAHPAAKRSRCVYPRGNYRESHWWKMLQCEDLKDHTSRAAKLFRRRFRIPYVLFVELVELVKEKKWFSTAEVDVAGRQCIPVELKVGDKRL